jgi:hypothetical protein
MASPTFRVSTQGWQTDFTRTSVDIAEIRGGGPPRDGIPPIDTPVYESLTDAREWLRDRSPVISLELGGAARAYPLAILTWHEMVNDTLGGTPALVTFCPLCNTAIVFERELEGTIYDFGTTGNLRRSNLVMYDRQTESWWQQATGQAIVGELLGKSLTFVAAQITSLADCARAYPDGDVLSRVTGHSRPYGNNPYFGYDWYEGTPFFFEGVVDGRLTAVARVVTVGDGDGAIAFPYSELEAVGVATAEIGGRQIVVLWTPGTASALNDEIIDLSTDVGSTGVFEATLDGQPLTLVPAEDDEGPPFTDTETGSGWLITGQAISGPLAGAQLTPVVHSDHFWFSWAAFAPQTAIWQAP